MAPRAWDLAHVNKKQGLRFLNERPSCKVYGDFSDIYLYLTSFHWAMAQITLGAIELVASNSAERVFNIFLLFAGLLFSSTFVSSLSATMISFEMRSTELNNKMSVLRQFLRQNRVEGPLALRVRQQVENRIRKPMMLTVRDVDVLAILSTSLRTELHFSMCKAHMYRNPLFRLWSFVSLPLVQELCVESPALHLFGHGRCVVCRREAL